MEQKRNREIARAEYFSGANEPTITIKKHMVRFSAYCLSELPGVDYVQFVMYPTEKRLVIEPCPLGERDAIRWSSKNPEHRKPKIITCKEYYRRLCRLMEWKEDCRYTILGKVTGEGDDTVIAFDLTSALVYRPNADGRISREPEYPKAWGDSFGMPEEEHRNNPLVKCFTKDTALLLVADPVLHTHENVAINTEEDEYEQQLLSGDAV
jgi:hypothetical protein